MTNTQEVSLGLQAPSQGSETVADSSKREKKINLLIVASGLGIGGAEVVMRDLAQTIDRSRFNVSVCCIKVGGHVGDELSSVGIDPVMLSTSKKPGVKYFSFLKLLKLIREKQIDVVHTHTTDGLVDAGICKLFRPGLKLIHTFHFGNYPHVRSRILLLERVFSRLATRLFAVGEVQRRQLRSVLFFREQAIGTVLNGVSLASGLCDSSFRARVGAENRILIGTIATFIEQKGLRDFMAVAKRFRHLGHKVRFVLVGEGPLRPELEALRRELGLEDLVAFSGWVPSASKFALPAFDVFFQPSLWEAMSVAILEAMAAGKPIVATRVGETPHIIEDEVDGLLVNPKDVDGMAADIGRLIDDPELRRRLGNAAARKVAQRFTVTHMTQAYERVYLETVFARTPDAA